MARRGAGEGGAQGGDEAGRLLATPPSRFTAERDALARARAERGDAAGAAALRKLRRPVGLAWVLNRVARDRRDDIEALLGAGDRLRAGQRRALAGEGATALRAAEQELRAAARALRQRAGEVLAEEGREPSPAMLARVELLLRVAATAPGDAREALRAGTFSREPEVAAGDLSGLGLVAGGAGAAKPARPAPAPARPAVEPGRVSAPPRAPASASARDAEARRAERAERARMEREARLRARALAAARSRLEQAERAARAARRAADAAARGAEEARVRADRAEAAAAARRGELEALERG